MAWNGDEGTGETANAGAGYSSRGDVVCEGMRQGVGVGVLTGTVTRRPEQVGKRARKRE